MKLSVVIDTDKLTESTVPGDGWSVIVLKDGKVVGATRVEALTEAKSA